MVSAALLRLLFAAVLSSFEDAHSCFGERSFAAVLQFSLISSLLSFLSPLSSLCHRSIPSPIVWILLDTILKRDVL